MYLYFTILAVTYGSQSCPDPLFPCLEYLLFLISAFYLEWTFWVLKFLIDTPNYLSLLKVLYALYLGASVQLLPETILYLTMNTLLKINSSHLLFSRDYLAISSLLPVHLFAITPIISFCVLCSSIYRPPTRNRALWGKFVSYLALDSQYLAQDLPYSRYLKKIYWIQQWIFPVLLVE